MRPDLEAIRRDNDAGELHPRQVEALLAYVAQLEAVVAGLPTCWYCARKALRCRRVAGDIPYGQEPDEGEVELCDEHAAEHPRAPEFLPVHDLPWGPALRALGEEPTR